METGDRYQVWDRIIGGDRQIEDRQPVFRKPVEYGMGSAGQERPAPFGPGLFRFSLQRPHHNVIGRRVFEKALDKLGAQLIGSISSTRHPVKQTARSTEKLRVGKWVVNTVKTG